MSAPRTSIRRLISTLAIAGCVLTGFPAVLQAQQGSGFTLFSGVRSEDQLPYHLDFGGQPNMWDRYRLRIPAKKMKLAVSQFAVLYPNYYKGDFDPKGIEVTTRGKKIPVQDVKWDKDNHLIEINLQEPVPAGKSVELVFSNVKNPAFGGVFYFNCEILSPGDVPLRRALGTWILSIEHE